MPRGRKPRPPRTDPGEIQRNRDDAWTKAQERAAALYPRHARPPVPTDPPERAAAAQAEIARITALDLPPVRVTVIKGPEDLRDVPEGVRRALRLDDFFQPQAPEPTLSERIQRLKERMAQAPHCPASLRAELAKLEEEIAAKLDHPHGLDLDPSGGWLTAEDIKFLASDGLVENLARALPQRPPWKAARPQWVDRAFIDSISLVNGRLCNGQMTAEAEVTRATRLIEERLLKDQAFMEATTAGAVGPFVDAIRRAVEQDDTEAMSPLCFCCGVTAAVLLERSAQGLRTLFTHSVNIEKLWQPFAAGAATEDRADMFLRIVVPTYNAISYDSRRCADCGRMFAMRALKEVEESHRCDDCSGRYHARESQRRRRAAPDLSARARGRERGDTAIAAAECQAAKVNLWEEEEHIVWLLDQRRAQHAAQGKGPKPSGPVKGHKKESNNPE